MSLEINSLEVAYGARPIIRGLSFSVQKGEVVGLIGPNGAGKTTLMRAISGVIPIKRGGILFDGIGLSSLSPLQRAGFLAVVPQARDLPEAFTVRQTVQFGRTPYMGWFGKITDRDQAAVDWAMERTHLLEMQDRLIGELSGGEQQRVLLARALAQQTPVLLLDEPTSNLDLQHQSILLNLARELAQERKLAVLMALHDLNMAALYTDRVALLVGGTLRQIGRPEEVLTPQSLMEAYRVPVHVIPHPDYGTPLVLPDGRDSPRR
jgi:iron complex transport system ATP-binding protein